MRSSIFLVILIYALPDIASAATEYATFGAFYKESSAIGWVLAAVVALFIGAIIFLQVARQAPLF